MTEKINVAEILKSKPVGTMLYDKARNISVYLKDVAKGINGCYAINCTIDTDGVRCLGACFIYRTLEVTNHPL